MKNSITILIISLIFPVISFSQGTFVDENEARIVAENFYFERARQHNPVNAEQVKAGKSYSIIEGSKILYYVFDISSGGFVAVSACSATPPVLYYAFAGNYKPSDQPENFRAWVGQYERQIAFAIATEAAPSSESFSAWNYYLETPVYEMVPFHDREILPLTTSTWNQGNYYNALCPADPAGPSGHCYTGCVATAMGQILNYFRWPETGTGSYTYECPPYGTLSADFENSEYRWDLMETSLEHHNYEVAEVLYHLGVSVDMVYGPDGSGMYNHKAAYSMKTYFKYSPETQYVFRDSTSMDWDSLIVAHLDRKIPMYYAGWSVPDTMGHAFVCDGYQGEHYFHFNWGWGGTQDGYFYTDNLTPGGNNFNLAQELIINAVPDTSLYAYPVLCQGEQEYTSLFGTIDDGSGPLYNYGNSAGCNWLITPADSVNGITLDFLQFSTDTNDHVTVYDGGDISAPVLGIFSGEDLPPDVTSTGSSMLVVFESDTAISADGFLASFESVIPVYCNGTVILTAQSDTIADGSGNWNYHDNSTCLWRIMPEGASYVTLYFTEFATEAGIDLVKIYDMESQLLLAEYSGTYPSGVPDPVTSPSGKIFLAFITDAEFTAPGWEAFFESDAVGINEEQDNSGLLVFPNPCQDMLTVQFSKFPGNNANIFLSDLSGRKLISEEIKLPGEQQLQINVQHLSPGIYIISCESTQRPAEYHKIIIR